MFKWTKWVFSSLNIKRWIVLVLLALFVFGLGLGGRMGQLLQGFRVDILDPGLLHRWQSHVKGLRFVDFLLIAIGIWGIVFGVKRFTYSVLALAGPRGEREVTRAVLARARRRRGPKIVAVGGGTGLPNLLSGLKGYTDNLTAVVTMADDGGSSGRLRKDLDMPPPGDLRNCLVALAETEPLMSKLFQHRFGQKGSLQGHSFGNLFIAALAEATGDFNEAVRQSSRVLAISGQVLPVTDQSIQLRAHLANGKVVTGESLIPKVEGRIEKMELLPSDCRPNPEVLEAIGQADAVVLGPGSLYTSILPNLLVPGVAEAIRNSRALKIYVCNVATQPGETDGYKLSDHLAPLVEIGGEGFIQVAFVNSERAEQAVLDRYLQEGQQPVEPDRRLAQKHSIRVVEAPLLEKGPYLRHDPKKLSKALVRLMLG